MGSIRWKIIEGDHVICMMEDGFMINRILFTTQVTAASYWRDLIARWTVAQTNSISSIGGNLLHATCQGNHVYMSDGPYPKNDIFFFCFVLKLHWLFKSKSKLVPQKLQKKFIWWFGGPKRLYRKCLSQKVDGFF